jgi:hypothetical protein
LLMNNAWLSVVLPRAEVQYASRYDILMTLLTSHALEIINEGWYSNTQYNVNEDYILLKRVDVYRLEISFTEHCHRCWPTLNANLNILLD